MDLLFNYYVITETNKEAFLSHKHTICKISKGNKGPGGLIPFIRLNKVRCGNCYSISFLFSFLLSADL